MKRPGTQIRSTSPRECEIITHHIPTKATPQPNTAPYDTVPENSNVLLENPVDAVHNIFCVTALSDKQKGTLYTDTTGALPAISLDGHQCVFLAFNWDTNYVFAKPI